MVLIKKFHQILNFLHLIKKKVKINFTFLDVLFQLVDILCILIALRNLKSQFFFKQKKYLELLNYIEILFYIFLGLISKIQVDDHSFYALFVKALEIHYYHFLIYHSENYQRQKKNKLNHLKLGSKLFLLISLNLKQLSKLMFFFSFFFFFSISKINFFKKKQKKNIFRIQNQNEKDQTLEFQK